MYTANGTTSNNLTVFMYKLLSFISMISWDMTYN